MDYSQEYFTIESLESGNVITLTIGFAVTTSHMTYVAWSKDKTNWNMTNIATSTQTISVNADANEKVYWKGSGLTYSSGGDTSNQWSAFSATKTHKVYGNILSLLYGDNFIGVTSLPSGSARNFGDLFRDDTTLTDASCLVLAATTLRGNCYQYMFYGCTSLTAAPELPASTLSGQCYQLMFYGCTSLTKSPVLRAKNLSTNCYKRMFYGCTNLQKVTCLATDISATDCLSNWLYGVAASGAFYKNASMTSFPSGASGIPSGWTVDTANTFAFNGHYPDDIKLNGVSLDYLKVDGTVVWAKANV